MAKMYDVHIIGSINVNGPISINRWVRVDETQKQLFYGHKTKESLEGWARVQYPGLTKVNTLSPVACIPVINNDKEAFDDEREDMEDDGSTTCRNKSGLLYAAGQITANILIVVNFLLWIAFDVYCWYFTGETLGWAGLGGAVTFVISAACYLVHSLIIGRLFGHNSEGISFKGFINRIKLSNIIAFGAVIFMILLFGIFDWLGVREFISSPKK
jgi:hypothetical protein